MLDIPDELRTAFVSPIELSFEVDELRYSVLADQHARDGILALVQSARTLLRLAVHPEEVTREHVAPLAPMFERVMAALGLDDIHALWTYVISAFEPQSPLRDILINATSQELRHVYATIYDEAIAKGRAKGIAEGEAKGITRMLERLMAKRGLTLTDELRERLATCEDEAQLQRWFDRALMATSTAEIFDE